MRLEKNPVDTRLMEAAEMLEKAGYEYGNNDALFVLAQMNFVSSDYCYGVGVDYIIEKWRDRYKFAYGGKGQTNTNTERMGVLYEKDLHSNILSRRSILFIRIHVIIRLP